MTLPLTPIALTRLTPLIVRLYALERKPIVHVINLIGDLNDVKSSPIPRRDRLVVLTTPLMIDVTPRCLLRVLRSFTHGAAFFSFHLSANVAFTVVVLTILGDIDTFTHGNTASFIVVGTKSCSLTMTSTCASYVLFD